jgi:poly [ADP-ribose] polymerase
MDDVHKFVGQILQFIDVGATARLLLGSQLKPYDLHPVDYAYNGLGVRLTPLDRKDPTFALVERYVHASSAVGSRSLELWNVFALDRRGEAERFEVASKGLANRTLLWHGSGLVNFNGILSQGLRIAPPEADASGLAFGKGIYLADSFNKSVGYCRSFSGSYGTIKPVAAAQSRYSRYGSKHNTNDDDDESVDPTSSKCLLLCEAALGVSFPAHEAEYMEAPKPGTHSTMALGSQAPDPARSVVTSDGIIVPCGPLQPVHPPDGWRPPRPGVPYACVAHNEFVVYNEGQVRTKFLVQVGPPRKKYLRRMEREAKRAARREKEEREEREKAFKGEA